MEQLSSRTLISPTIYLICRTRFTYWLDQIIICLLDSSPSETLPSKICESQIVFILTLYYLSILSFLYQIDFFITVNKSSPMISCIYSFRYTLFSCRAYRLFTYRTCFCFVHRSSFCRKRASSWFRHAKKRSKILAKVRPPKYRDALDKKSV